MENNKKETFNYTYSAKEQEEIKNIRKKYISQEEDKMDYLRKLDASVTGKATTSALIIGIVGTLLLGFGMSIAMSDFGKMLFGSYQDISMITGSIIGIGGIILICLAYPVYNRVVKKEREKIAPEILRLTDELMK